MPNYKLYYYLIDLVVNDPEVLGLMIQGLLILYLGEINHIQK